MSICAARQRSPTGCRRPRHLTPSTSRSPPARPASFYGTFFHFRRRAMRATRLLFLQCLVENHSSPSERPTSAARAVRRPALQRARGVFVVSPTSCSDRQFGSTPIHILLQSARSYCSRLNALPVARLLAQMLPLTPFAFAIVQISGCRIVRIASGHISGCLLGKARHFRRRHSAAPG